MDDLLVLWPQCPVCGPLNAQQVVAVHSSAYYEAYERLIKQSALHGPDAYSRLSSTDQAILEQGRDGAGGFVLPHDVLERIRDVWTWMDRQRRAEQ
jgi:hypothetical protein